MMMKLNEHLIELCKMLIEMSLYSGFELAARMVSAAWQWGLLRSYLVLLYRKCSTLQDVTLGKKQLYTKGSMPKLSNFILY
jgi:hypothetical protein